jgi:hypothetical protein
MGLYFEGRIVSDARILKFLLTDEPKTSHIGNQIWVLQNQKTGKTIITGDEGNGWCVKLTEGGSKEEAMAKLKAKREKNEVFTEFIQETLKEDPDAT